MSKSSKGNKKNGNHPKLHVLDHEPSRQELHKALVELDLMLLEVGNAWLNIDNETKRLRRLYLKMKEMLDMSLRPTVIKPVKPAVKPIVRPIEVTILTPKRKRITTTTNPKETK
jgi:hypothetical protein